MCQMPGAKSDTSYYDVLGLDKACTDADLKKAYRKQAMKWHPDKNKGSAEAEERFKEVSAAFDVLSDPDKRAVYDRYGKVGLEAGVPPEGADGAGWVPGPGAQGRYSMDRETAERIFEQVFGGGATGAPFAFGSAGGGLGGFPAGGGFSAFNFGGPGGASIFGGDVEMMDSDDSTGFNRKRKAPAVERELPLSLEELYTGCTKRLRVSPHDGGAPELLCITVKPGWKQGTKITFPGKGGLPSAPNHVQIPRDLVFVVKEKPHPIFTRGGNDLSAKVRVPLVKALCGGEVQVESLTNKNLLVNVPEDMEIDTEVTVPGEGMPDQKGGPRGNLKLQLQVEMPKRLTPWQKQQLQTIL